MRGATHIPSMGVLLKYQARPADFFGNRRTTDCELADGR
jgi:hypothetical protein